MFIDLTCPAEVFRALLPTRDIPAVSLTLFNLSDRIIVSAEVTLRLLGEGGAELEKVVFRGRGLHGRPRSTFPMNVPCTRHEGVKEAEVTLEKIWFSDNAVWRRNPADKTEYTPNALPVSRGLTDLKFVAGETAVGYPSLQRGLWVCVCGRPNPEDQEVCVRCGRERVSVFTRFNREAVEKQVRQRERQLDLSTRSAREDTARLQRIREEEYRQKQKVRRRRIRLAAALGLCLALAAGMLFFVEPLLRLTAARRTLNRGETAAARESLAQLGSFLDAPELLEISDFRLAGRQALEAETPAELAAASEKLRGMTVSETLEGMDAAALADRADFRRAEAELKAGSWEAAREALSALPEGYEGREALEADCGFAEAQSLMDRRFYQQAREAFLALGSYPGAAEKAAECIYLPAVEMLENGELDAAMQELSRIPDFRDSRRQVLRCHYLKGKQLQESGDLAQAGAEYLMAGDWEDAQSLSQEMVYLQAEDAWAREDWLTAASLYESIPEWRDSADRRRTCLYELAEQAMKDREYELALTRMRDLPDDFLDVAVLRAQAAYQGGREAMKRSDWAAAVEMLETASGYKDADAQALKARESLAQSLLDAGDAEGAAALLPKLTESRSYEALQRRTEYLRAVKAQEEGAPVADSLARFEALGSYEDSAERVKSLYYQLGQAAEKRGEVLQAADDYLKAGNWSDAADKAKAMYDLYYGERVSLARDAMKKEDYALAVTLLGSLNREALPKEYKEIGNLYLEACVEAGKQLYHQGKPYDGLVYFRMAEADSSAARSCLRYSCYRILGAWADRDGSIVAEFREDGTCTIAGEEFRFLVPDSFNIRTSQEAEGELMPTHRIGDLTDTRLILRDARPGKNQSWTLTRPGSAAEETPETEPDGGEGTEDPAESYAVDDTEDVHE